ncbi:hypothetical protein C7B67_17650 [filamentous cyanobacterium Phorm 6]|nr:hypothetical protein C7B67_17650 [filamentous cyanobacterium Phorm 6]
MAITIRNEGRRKKEEGRRKKEEGKRKKEEVRGMFQLNVVYILVSIPPSPPSQGGDKILLKVHLAFGGFRGI